MNIKQFFRNNIAKYYPKFRILLYKYLSNNSNVTGTPVIRQPVLFVGLGQIVFDDKVCLGYYPSPLFFDSSIYIEARERDSLIKIGKNTIINNGTKIICDKTSITLGANLLIGINVEILDSDFHGVHPHKRRSPDYKCFPVVIEDDVFIGNNVIIMKGVTIGKNSIIANSSLVINSVPPNSVAAGCPAKVIKSVYE